MADFSSFYQKSVYFTIIMFIFILIFNFIQALSIFGVAPIGPVIGNDPQQYTNSTFGSIVSFQNIWSVGAGVAISGAVLTAILTGSMIAVGVYLFSVTFWTGFASMYLIFSSLFIGSTMTMFLGVGFAIMLVIFIAAVIGMLSGSG